MMNNEELKSNLSSSKHWLRLVFMLLFAVILYLASIVISVVVVLQFLFSLITGQDNINIRQFGSSLSTYIYQTLKFLTYSSEEKPFPFSDWPDAVDPARPVAENVVVVTAEVTETSASVASVGEAPINDTSESDNPDGEAATKKHRVRKVAPKDADDSELGI